MQFNLYQWLFDDATAQFHYSWPYLIACGVGLLIWFYYWVEGRKRFVSDRHALKYMFDRYLNWLAIICFVGVMIDLARWALVGYFFAWRFWRYLWLVSLLVWAVFFIIYRVRVYSNNVKYFAQKRKNDEYVYKSEDKDKIDRRSHREEKKKEKTIKMQRRKEKPSKSRRKSRLAVR